jgi:hypothetical protein
MKLAAAASTLLVRRFLTCLLACSLLSAAEIPQGTHVLLKMVNSISTRTASEGDQVYLQTASPVALDGQIVVPPGSYVQGRVSHTKRSGRVKGRAELGIRIETLTLPSGKVLTIAPRLSSVDSGENGQKVNDPKTNNEDQITQGSSVGRDVQRVAITAGTGAAIGGIADRSFRGAGIGAGAGTAVGLATALLTRGNEVELKPGTTLDVVFDRDVVIE